MKIVVAPLAGARIEIIIVENPCHTGHVAPLAGARIEIYTGGYGGSVTGSLPSRERGLKYDDNMVYTTELGRSPRGSAD